jgi:thiamine biosynthesis lipoprotein
MGTDVHVLVIAASARDADSALDRSSERIEALEGVWSRFRPTSEVSLLNAMAGMPVRVSAETIVLVERALDGHRLTSGRFDPTVLGDVIRAGYDRTYDEVRGDERPIDGRGLGAASIEIDPVAGLVRLPAGVGFDPGGIGKGLAADIVVAEMIERVDGICVNLGGDLRVAGTAPDPAGWVVAIDDPFGGDLREVVCLTTGAVATSSRLRRVLGTGHHLIDPTVGGPAVTGLATATAIAGRGWLAEVLAKAAFLAGPEEGLRLLTDAGADGVLVRDDGQIVRTTGADRFVRAAVAS